MAMNALKLFGNFIAAASALLPVSAFVHDGSAAAGNADLSFNAGSGVNGPVYALVVQPDGKTIIGGNFSVVRGVACQNIARLRADDRVDPTFDAGEGYLPNFGRHKTDCQVISGIWSSYLPILSPLFLIATTTKRTSECQRR
jgi:hypothetical protein